MEGGTTAPIGVLEFRRYTLLPGARDVLIDLFERHLIAPQEELGAQIIGHFRDLDHPDRFVWLRAFRDLPSRRRALEAFYSSEVWGAHRDAANATLVDHEDVFLLRPPAGTDLRHGLTHVRPPDGERRGVFTSAVWQLAAPLSADAVTSFGCRLERLVQDSRGTWDTLLLTEPTPNNYPRLRIREGEDVIVAFARFDDVQPARVFAAVLHHWQEGRALTGGRAPETLQLAPCAHSRLT